MGGLIHTRVESPVGALLLVSNGLAIVSISFGGTPPDGSVESRAGFEEAVDQLNAYFARQLREFTLPLEPQGTPFQLRVWQELRAIPYGETRSYSEVAKAIGRPGSVRAVGAANGANPLPIVVPCHRVIGADGSLTGFGGGLPAKRFLLDLESLKFAF